MPKPITDADRAAARAANAMPFDLTGAVVDRSKPDAKNVVSARVDQHVCDFVIAEAVRTGQSASQVINDLLNEAITGRANEADLVVSLADLRRVVAQVAHPAAA